MPACPLCNEKGRIPENKIHFGDSQPREVMCPVCKGCGQVDILPSAKRTITIIKPHGEWRTQE